VGAAAVDQTLQHCQKDADLAGIREPDAVARLPADEREACKKLWAIADALLKKMEEKEGFTIVVASTWAVQPGRGERSKPFGTQRMSNARQVK
jgi:hypothetical protein